MRLPETSRRLAAALLLAAAHADAQDDAAAIDVLRPGDRIALLLPVDDEHTRMLCERVGEQGHVHIVRLAPQDAAPVVPCANASMLELKPRLQPAPELWSSSDDPGGVYEYWTSIPAAETFAAPEALDAIWLTARHAELRGESYGRPDLLRVHQAFLQALKPGGQLVVEPAPDSRETSREAITAGFRPAGEQSPGQFRKPLR